MNERAAAARRRGAKVSPVALALGGAGLATLFSLALGCATRHSPAAGWGAASFGAEFRNHRPKNRAELSWPEEGPGAEVATTVEGGPAYLAGWRSGDRIASLAGRPVLSACRLEREIAALPIGERVAVEVVREGEAAPRTIEIEPVDGAALFDRLCREGRADACAELGRLTIVSSTTPAEVDAALALYEQACQGGDPSGCSELAGHLVERAGETAAARAAEIAKKGCDGGYPAACSHLGLLYATGGGVGRDDARATALYEIACDGGDPAGCYNVGLNYEKQRGVPRNDARSLLGYVRGCEGGYPQACTNLGYLYDRGIGVVANPERAAKLYERACAGDECTAGDPLGCANFGIFLRDGRGVSKDEARAARMFAAACAREVGAACNNLGILIEPEDAGRAMELYRKACRFGSSGGCSNAGVEASTQGPPQV